MSALPEAPKFPFQRECPFHPPKLYAQARDAGPAFEVTLWNGKKAWILTHYDDVKAVLSDERFTGEMGRSGFPAVTEARRAIDKQERAFIAMDNPDHDRYRRMFTKEFSARRMMALKPKIEALAERLITEMKERGNSADVYTALAVEFPSLVMCDLIGSPYEDHVFIMKCAAARHGLNQSVEEAHSKARELVAYMRRLIDEKAESPCEDMVSRVIADYVVPGALTRDEFAEIGALILRAGHDTTTNMIGMGTLLLLQNETLRRKLAADPSLMSAAVEEMLRFVSPVQFAPRRMALEDVDLRGVKIQKGDGIFPLLPAANRDGCVFENPHDLDIDRDASHHVAFGYGIHQCLGQILARIELQVMFTAILKHLPGMRLAVPLEEIRFKSDMQIYGLYNLPVTW